MLNVFQLNHAIDSMQQSANEVMANFSKSIKNEHLYFQASNFKDINLRSTGNAPIVKAANEVIHIDSLTKEEKIAALTNIPSNLRRINQNLEGQFTYFDALYQNVNLYFIGFHRKFALTYAIIVLFFIGAPLGAIIRKGGFGTPLVLAALLFMLYFILISVGESLATENVVSPFVGMWFASLVLTPIAFILMRAAANDSQVFNKEAYSKFFKRFKRKK